jgi:hypothetical protein
MMNIPWEDFNVKQQELYELMSDISEDCWCAGWLDGNEYSIWDAMQTGNLTYGMGAIDKESLEKVRELSKELNGWVIWDDALNENAFVTADEWLKILNEFYKDLKANQ